jgi:hypothetical protein
MEFAGPAAADRYRVEKALMVGHDQHAATLGQMANADDAQPKKH